MPSKTFAVKFGVEGQQALVAATKQAGDAFDTLLAKSQKLATEAQAAAKKALNTADVAAYNRAVQQGEKAAVAANRAIAASYRELGVTSTRSIEDQKQRAVAAYEAIKKSGVASAQDIARAQTQLAIKLRELDGQLDRTNQGTKALSGGFTTLKGALANLAASAVTNIFSTMVNGFGAIVSSIGRAGVETENLKARLKVLEGGTQQAAKAFQQISDFAGPTNFEIPAVTEAYITLKNRGIDPTIKALTQLGDISNASGKPLQQTVEALLDATQGEFERLKEFGIQAKKNGDQVTLTYKGVTQVVQNSEQAIAAAILKFGELPGILGSTAEAGRTTAGRLSTINDQIGQISAKVFESLKPATDAVLGLFTDMLAPLANNKELLDETSKIAAEIAAYFKANPGLAEELGQTLKDAVLGTVRAIGQLIKDWLKFYGENRKELEAIAKVLGTVFEWSYKIGSWWRDVMIGSFKAVLNTVKSIYDFLEKSFRVITQPLNPDSWFAQAQRGQPLNGPTTLPGDGTPLNLIPVPSVPIPGGRGTVPPPPGNIGPQQPTSNLDRLGLRGLQVAPGAVVDGKVVPFLPSSSTRIPGVTPGSFGTTPPKASPDPGASSRLRALQRAASILGVTVEDIVTIMLKESGGKNVASGGSGGVYRGYFQMGPQVMAEFARQGVLPGTSQRANDYTFEQQVELFTRHALQPFRGFKPGQPGMDVRALYNQHNLGSVGATGVDGFGTPGGRSPDLLPGSPLRRQAQQYLAGLGDKGLSGFDAIQNDLKAQEAARKAQEKADKERAEAAKDLFEERARTVNQERELAQKAEENAEKLRQQADTAALSLKLQREQIGLKDADLDRAKAIADAQKRLLEIDQEIANLARQRAEVNSVAEVEQVDRLIQLRTQEKQVVQDNLRAELEGIAEIARQRAKEAADKKAQLAQDFAGRTGDYQVGALQTEAEILSRQGLEFEANALRQRAAILQENIRLQKELAEINREFATEPGMAAELERLARAQSQLNLQAMEGQFQTLGDAILDVGENALGQLIEGLFTGEVSFRNLALTAVKAIGQIAAKILTSQIIKLLGGLFGGLGGGGLGSGFGLFSSSSPTLSGFGGGGLGTSFGGFLGGFATGGTVGGAIARERGLSRGRKVSLAAITHGEQVLSILSGEAQRYQSLQDTLGPNPLAALVGGYGGISIRATDSPSGYAPAGGTAVSNWYIQTPDVASFNRSRQDILLAQAEETKRAQRRG